MLIFVHVLRNQDLRFGRVFSGTHDIIKNMKILTILQLTNCFFSGKYDQPLKQKNCVNSLNKFYPVI